MLKYVELIVKRGFWVVPITWMAIFYAIKIYFGKVYSPDSYAFYFLGKNIIAGNGYYSPTIRDFYLDPAGPLLSRSSPPLYPILVGITDFFLNEGVAAGLVINLFISIAVLYLWFVLSKRISGYLFLIPFLLAIMYTLLPSASLWVDAAAGRTALLTWFLLLMTLYLLSSPLLFTDKKISVGVGICLGLLTLTRFDTTLFCVSLPLIICFSTRLPVKKVILMYAALILVMTPWAIRNFVVFDSFFASSESITVAANVPGIVPLQFFANGVPLGVNDPQLWIQQRLTYLESNIWFFHSFLLQLYKLVNIEVAISLFVKIVACLYLPGFIFSFIGRHKNHSLWIYFITSLTWTVFNIICLSLTSYGNEMRYYAISWFFIVGGGLFFVTVIFHQLIALISKNRFLPKIEKISIGVVSGELLLCFMLVFLTIRNYAHDVYFNKLDDTGQRWAQLAKNIPVKKGELVATNSPEFIAYYTGWNTIYIPHHYRGLENIPMNPPSFDKNYEAWLHHWKPTYLLINSYDFSNPLAIYPHASVSTVLDKLVLLRINLDESMLTEQDKIEDAEKRLLWLRSGK